MNSKTNPHDIVPDLDAAQHFLDDLGGDIKFTFMVIPEGQDCGLHRSPQELHGTLDQLGIKLGALNAIGHGIFVMINEGDLAGRKAKNVLKVRAQFVDLDGAPIEPVIHSDLPPHIVVTTSPGRYHAYWRIEACPLGEFKERQQALAMKFGGDMAVCDLPRVMRLPGFWHLKGSAPYLVKEIDIAGLERQQ